MGPAAVNALPATPTLSGSSTAPQAAVLPVAVQVASREGRRLVTHPLVLIGSGLYLAMIVVSSGQGPGSGYDGLVTGPTFFLGVFTYFATHLTASRPQRDHCTEQHTSLPAPPLARTAGLCLAAVAPALLAAGLMGLVMLWSAAGRVDFAVWPSPGELAAGPLTVLGGALLGVMVARWVRFPTASVLVILAVIVVNFTLSEATNRYELLGPYASFTVYVDNGSWGGRRAGSFGWHAVYLAALCGMAAAGALLRDARRRLLPLAAGAVCTVAALIAGIAQLP